MSEGDITSIILFIILLVLSAFFSGSETALIGSKRVKLISRADQGSKGAKKALELLEDPGALLGTILVGNNLVNVAAAAIAATLLGPVYATIFVTLALLMIGEIPPKTMAAQWPERIARLVSYPIAILKRLFLPFVWITTTLTDLILLPITRKMGPQRRFFSREELQTALDLSADAGELEPAEARMAQEVLDLDEMRIRDVMIPLEKTSVVYSDWSFQRLLDEIRIQQHTRYPIMDRDQLLPIGMLHVKDILISGNNPDWLALKRNLPWKSQNTHLDDLLRDMQIERYHFAGVLDGDGAPVGFVMMESVLEEIVGEIADEHDQEDDPIHSMGPNKYCVRGDLEMADISRILNVELPIEVQEMSIASLYAQHLGSKSTAKLHIGDALIRRSKRGYLVTVLENPNGHENGNGDGHDDDDDDTGTRDDETSRLSETG